MKVLIVEDNVRFCSLVSEHLETAGFVVDATHYAEDFRGYISTCDYDIFLVDLNLPDGSGISLIRELRRARVATPILIMTAQDDVDTRVEGLDAGADDYLSKPFNYRELVARMRALLRRSPQLLPEKVLAGQIEMDRTNGEIFCNGKRLELRPSEQRLLALMIRRIGRTVPRSTIESALQSLGNEKSANAIDKLVSRLRTALSDTSAGVQLKTIRGNGYVLEVDRRPQGRPAATDACHLK